MPSGERYGLSYQSPGVTEPRTSKRPKNPLPRAGGFSCPRHSQRPRQGEDLHMGLSATRNRGCYHTRPIAFGWSLCLWPQRLVLQEGGGHCPRERSQRLFRRAYRFPQNRRLGAALYSLWATPARLPWVVTGRTRHHG